MTESVARLRGDQLTLGYGSYTVAKNLIVSTPDGHFTAIIDSNGRGTPTLLRTLCRLMTPVHGLVWSDGAQISRYPLSTLPWRRGVAR
ncbi:iron-enterobactin transporter ATP-binding protein, partial [Leptospira borgpetersenii serovar Hardjo-bovis]|nr:iron-enterobactin transporter ATP-binding protein [Leptospira borgpetersenii serovar Hardjo-bovis]